MMGANPSPVLWAALRAPFPSEAVEIKAEYTGETDGRGLIPDDCVSHCDVCGKAHPMPAKHLRYVGHARITQRLNEVDPEWDWEPMAHNEKGLPLIDDGCLWIYLTILGITHKGVGYARNLYGADAKKAVIGDAIRNAAMRFGCGLEMWFTQDGEAPEDEAVAGGPAKRLKAAVEAVSAPKAVPFVPSLKRNATEAQKALLAKMEEAIGCGIDGNAISQWIKSEHGRYYYEVNRSESDDAIGYIQALIDDRLDADDDEVIAV